MISKCLALQKLEHGRRQSFRHTVDLIDEQYAFLQSGSFNHIINGCHNFTHGVFRNGVFPASICLLFNHRQTNGALPGMMGNGIRHKPDLALLGDLLHDLRLSHPRRPD